MDTAAIDTTFYYRLQTEFQAGENKCLEGNRVAEGSILDGAAFMDDCQNVTGQLWKFVEDGDGYYRLQTMFLESEDKCLEGNRIADESVLAGAAFMNDCQDVTGQLWKVVDNGDDTFRLQTQFLEENNKCFEGNRFADDAVLHGAAFMDDCQDVSGQLWLFDPVIEIATVAEAIAAEIEEAEEAVAEGDAPAPLADPVILTGQVLGDEGRDSLIDEVSVSTEYVFEYNELLYAYDYPAAGIGRWDVKDGILIRPHGENVNQLVISLDVASETELGAAALQGLYGKITPVVFTGADNQPIMAGDAVEVVLSQTDSSDLPYLVNIYRGEAKERVATFTISDQPLTLPSGALLTGVVAANEGNSVATDPYNIEAGDYFSYIEAEWPNGYPAYGIQSGDVNFSIIIAHPDFSSQASILRRTVAEAGLGIEAAERLFAPGGLTVNSDFRVTEIGEVNEPILPGDIIEVVLADEASSAPPYIGNVYRGSERTLVATFTINEQTEATAPPTATPVPPTATPVPELQMLSTFTGHTDSTLSVAWSPDGSSLASASVDDTIRVWNAASGETEATLTGHSNDVAWLAWSPDGRQLASGSSDTTVKVWDAVSGENSLTLAGHTGAINWVAWSPDGARILSGSSDRTVKVWNAASGENSLTLAHSGAVLSAVFSPDGARIASGADDSTVKIWDASSGENLLTLSGHTGDVWSIGYSPDGSRLLSSADDATVRIWDVATGEISMTLEGHTGSIWSAAWSPDGGKIASASLDGSVRVWNSTTGDNIAILTSDQASQINAVAWSPDNSKLVSGAVNGAVQVWILP